MIASSEWVLDHHDDPNLLMVDAREEAAYDARHIAGAVNLPYVRTYDSQEGSRTKLAPVAEINALFGAKGIDRRHTVVVYGDKSDFRPAARVFWTLEVLGHPRCAVLNGGMEAWMAAGLPTSTDRTVPTPATFVAEFDPNRLVDKLEVRRSLGREDITIVDSRGVAEYAGEEKKGEYSRVGHIPTAVDCDVKKLYAESTEVCELKDLAVLRDLYHDLGSKRVYVYCNTGRSAAVNYLALRALGADVALYDGSWTDWSADMNMPVATGYEPGAVQ